MKLLLTICFIVCMATVSRAAEQPSAVYDRVTIMEDVIWRGSIIVRGFVVVAPHVTLRIEPGTVVRFASASTTQLANLVVQGRLYAAGTPEQPIVFTPESGTLSRGEWGGIVLLSTEKRNQLEQCRIEYAQTGIEARFSSLHLKAVSIVHAQTALLSHDSVIQMTGGSVSNSDTGLEIYNSEFDARDIAVSLCQRGGVFHASAVVLTTSKITKNLQSGLEFTDCRIKVSGGNVSENVRGVRIKGGEGQLTMTGLLRNRESALHLTGSRIKIQRCLFADNIQDAVRTEDGLALMLNNAFSSNGGFNIYNAGGNTVSARQNWWGTTDRKIISQKNYDASRDKNSGIVTVSPWLNEKPQLMP